MYFSRCFYEALYQAEHIYIRPCKNGSAFDYSTQTVIKARGFIVYTGIMHVCIYCFRGYEIMRTNIFRTNRSVFNARVTT